MNQKPQSSYANKIIQTKRNITKISKMNFTNLPLHQSNHQPNVVQYQGNQQSERKARQMVQNTHNLRDTIGSYYKEGDVFARDQTYYDQLQPSTKRDRSRDKSPFNKTVDNKQPQIQKPSSSVLQPSQQLAKLRQENRQLRARVQTFNQGKTGNSPRKSKFASSSKQFTVISEQEAQIIKYEDLIKQKSRKIETYKKASEELELRMNNIRSIDGQIYKHLKNATLRDKQLLKKASNALAMGESREQVSKILKKIIDN